MSNPHLPKQIVLKKNEERRVLSGHPWVFSNEIREIKGAPGIGDVVEVLAASGLTLGIGFYNPHSLIAARLLSSIIEEVDAAFLTKRLSDALALRRTLYPDAETYRLVHGESDYLPGLVIDKYNHYLSIQTLSYGMDVRLPMICDVLDALLKPEGIVERNESPLRELEHLPLKHGILRGSVAPTTIIEHGIQYNVDLLTGQKTGFFLDQRENRFAARRFCKGKRVLDLFCNDGGFSFNAALAGAGSVLGVDSSEDAVTRASSNAALNGLTNVSFQRNDAFELLVKFQAEGERFDVIVLDPPSFTKSRKNVYSAKRGYKELNTGAIRLLGTGGTLLTASCSHHIEPEVFLQLVDESARKAGRRAQLLHWGGAAPDHPTLPAVPETRYLKFGIFRVI